MEIASVDKTSAYQFGNFVLDAQNNRLYRDDEVVSTDDKIVKALFLLCEAYPEAVDKDTLLEQLWPSQIVTEWSISKLISEIRNIIGDSGKEQGFIKTVRGQGFRMNTPVLLVDAPVSKPKPVLEKASSKRSSSSRYLAIASLVSVIIVSAVIVLFVQQDEAEATLDYPARIAVLPVTTAEESGIYDWVKYGVMAIVTEQLSQYKSLQTIPLDKVVTEINSDEEPTFSQICGQLGCSKMIGLSFVMQGSKPQVAFSIIDKDGQTLPVSFSGIDPIDATNQLLESLAVALIPKDNDILPLSSTFSDNNKTNRDYAIGMHELHSGELKEARKYLEMAIARETDFFWANANLADVIYRQGEFLKAAEFIENLELNPLSDDKAYFLMNLRSNILYSQGNIEDSLAVTLALKTNPHVQSDPLLYGNQSMNVGSSMQALGQNEDAIMHLNEARDSYAKAGYGSGEGKVLFNLGNVYLTSTDLDSAMDYYQQAKDVFIRYGMTGYALFVRHQMATTNTQLGNVQNSESELYLLIDEYQKIGDVEGEYTAINDLAFISLLQEDYEEAAVRASSAFEKLRTTEFSYLKQQIVNIGAKANLMLGHVEPAAELLSQLEGDWNDPRPSFVFLSAHVDYLRGNLQAALDKALALKDSMGDQWTDRHQDVLQQFQMSVDQNRQLELTY